MFDQKKLIWKKMSQKIEKSFEFFDISAIALKHPISKEQKTFYQFKSHDWVNIFALTEKKELVTIKLFRFGNLKLSIETPGGVVENKENLKKAAQRELLEETGYLAKKLELMGHFSPNPAINTNQIYYYLATKLEKKEQRLDENEIINVDLISIKKFEKLIEKRKIDHALVITGYYLLKKNLIKTGKN